MLFCGYIGNILVESAAFLPLAFQIFRVNVVGFNAAYHILENVEQFVDLK